jgi:hypothetical protein
MSRLVRRNGLSRDRVASFKDSFAGHALCSAKSPYRRRGRKMKERYLGEPARAHRLNAVRRAAGFASMRAAALKFGWPLGTYRGHEGATRRMPERVARATAISFWR